MEFYNPVPENIIRLTIRKAGFNSEYINLHKTNISAVSRLIKRTIESQNISPFVKGPVCAIDIRNCIGGKNGKSVSLSFKGLSPDKVKSLLTEAIINLKFS